MKAAPSSVIESFPMHLPRVLDPAAREYRVRYAIATILRDRIVNEGAFKNCFEMEDGEEVVRIILRRGLKNPKLRAALLGSHLINLHQWLAGRPDLMEAYYAPTQSTPLEPKRRTQRRRRPPG